MLSETFLGELETLANSMPKYVTGDAARDRLLALVAKWRTLGVMDRAHNAEEVTRLRAERDQAISDLAALNRSIQPLVVGTEFGRKAMDQLSERCARTRFLEQQVTRLESTKFETLYAAVTELRTKLEAFANEPDLPDETLLQKLARIFKL